MESNGPVRLGVRLALQEPPQLSLVPNTKYLVNCVKKQRFWDHAI